MIKNNDLTDDMRLRIRRAMWATWEIIASDVLEMSNGEPVSRDVVIEMVTDADRLRDNGGDREAADFYYALQYGEEDRNECDELAFPDKEYS